MDSVTLQTVFVSVGANVDPETNIARGLRLLARSVPVTGVSTFYRTPAIDRPAQPDYLNGVVRLETDQRPGRLRDLLREVEHALGRVRTADAFAPRPLDLDILLYGDAVITADGLEIPDPDIARRPFLAAGLLDLDPAIRLPGATEALEQQTDPAKLAALTPDPAFTRHLQETLFNEP